MIKIVTKEKQYELMKMLFQNTPMYQSTKYDAIRRMLEDDKPLKEIFTDIDDWPIEQFCCHCQNYACDLMHLGDEAGYDRLYTYLCLDCMAGAWNIMDKNNGA